MRVFSRLEVGTKLASVMTLILALVSVWIYLYFPPKLQRRAIEALTQKAAAIADVTAFSVAPGLHNHDRVAVAAAVTALRRDSDLTFFLVKSANGETFASFNDMVAASSGPFLKPNGESAPRRPVVTGMTAGQEGETSGAFSEGGTAYQTTTPIRYHGKNIGTLIVGFSLDRVVRETSRSRATVALVTLIAFAIGVLSVFAFSALITGPLRRIAETAERIAGGDMSSRAEAESTDEVGQLARTFNLMLDRIGAARKELEELNRTLERLDRLVRLV